MAFGPCDDSLTSIIVPVRESFFNTVANSDCLTIGIAVVVVSDHESISLNEIIMVAFQFNEDTIGFYKR